MFLDYYEILEIKFGVSSEEIKSAYRKQSLKWHPDRNPGKDTLYQMQLINEAYLILKDPEARIRYDNEYLEYKHHEHFKSSNDKNKDSSNSNQNFEYVFKDDILKKWMNNARAQAETLAKNTVTDFKRGAKAAGEEMFKNFIGFLIIGFILSLIFIISKSCN
jgi:curved DNA-binding protein CbpA